MIYKIGIFTRYKDRKRFGNDYHCSPSKIFKIVDALKGYMDLEYRVNDYSVSYDLAIVDRIRPSEKISANLILGIFEMSPKRGWATNYCSISPSTKIIGKNHFILPNYCHGKFISSSSITTSKKGFVYIGRVDPTAEAKICRLSRVVPSLYLYPIKYWYKKDVLRFHDNNFKKNAKILRKIMPNVTIVRPVKHKGLYKVLNDRAHKVGFVPSVHHFGSTKVQKESSSKFFDYIGAGIPVLVESSVPEAIYVKKNPFLGEIFCGEQDMVRKARKMCSGTYDFKKIMLYAKNNHSPKSRSLLIYNKVIKNLRA